MRRSSVSGPLLLLLLGLGLFAAGCGYSAGLVAPGGYDTIGVEIFGNDTKVRDIEAPFTERVARAASDLVGARMVPPGRADVVLRGRLVQVENRGGIRNRSNELIQLTLSITVEASLVERSTGAVLNEVRTRLWSGYLVRDNELQGGNVELVLAGMDEGQEAQDRLFRNLAEQLVLELFAPGQASEG